MCLCVSDELVDWDPWQPAATAAVVMDGGDDSGPHCDDPDFNVCQQYNNIIVMTYNWCTIVSLCI